jgi:DNA-binding transcriptional ArsR family regulator
MSAAELSRRMDLTKATMSHHVRILRLAGLINEEWAAGSVTLSVRRETLETLSDRTIGQLFDVA